MKKQNEYFSLERKNTNTKVNYGNIIFGGGGEISKWEMGKIIIYITKMGIMLQKWGLSNASKNCFECHGYQYAISQTQKLKITGN